MSSKNKIGVQEHWANLNGMKIRYLEYGTAHHRYVLFIHGLGSSADRWLDIPSVLSAKFHTIAIDLPGFGESDKPATMDYTIKNFRDVVTDFINSILVDDHAKISVVGHSLGGYIAAEVSMKIINKIERLVLIDSSGMLKKPTPLLEEYLDVAMNPTKDRVRQVFEQMVANPTRIPTKLVESFITRINLPNAKHAFKSTLQNSANTQIQLERLNLIEGLPVLIIWGLEDKVIPVEHSRLFNESLVNSQVKIIPDTGHAPFAEKPKQICEMLCDFLA